VKAQLSATTQQDKLSEYKIEALEKFEQNDSKLQRTPNQRINFTTYT